MATKTADKKQPGPVAPVDDLAEDLGGDPLGSAIPTVGDDPLAEDIGQIDTSYPVLVVGLYDLEITDAKIEKSKKTNKDMLVVTMKTTAEAMDTNQSMINKGFPVYHRVSLEPTAEYDMKSIAKKIAAVGQAAGITGMTARELLNNPKVLVDKTVRVKLGISKETDEYPAGNSVKQFLQVT